MGPIGCRSGPAVDDRVSLRGRPSSDGRVSDTQPRSECREKHHAGHNGHIGHTGHTEELKRWSIQYGKRLGSEGEVERCVTRQQPPFGDVEGKTKPIDYNFSKEKRRLYRKFVWEFMLHWLGIRLGRSLGCLTPDSGHWGEAKGLLKVGTDLYGLRVRVSTHIAQENSTDS